MKLAELQQYFAAAATSGRGPLAEVEEVFRGSESLPASARLAIYNRGYYYRLLDALATVFGETQRALGAAEFERIGLAYLTHHPSQHPAVERVGRWLPEHLRSLASVPRPIADLAALEWARLCALVAPDPGAVLRTAHALVSGEFPGLQLRFVPALHLLEVDPRALRLFARAALDSTPTAPFVCCAVAVWRAGHIVRHEALTPVEFQALRAAMAGAAMNQVCTHFDTGAETEDAQQAFRVISSWFTREWVEKRA